MARTATALRPMSEVWEWQMLGRCRDRSGAQFFHPDDDLGRISRRLREAAAKRLCETCPVRRECATHALSVGEEYGVWGGFSETERALLRDLGWRDALDPRRLADVNKLERRIQSAHRAREAQKQAATTHATAASNPTAGSNRTVGSNPTAGSKAPRPRGDAGRHAN